MKYVKFFYKDLSGILVEACGSDSYIKVDGRYTIGRIKRIVSKYRDDLKIINKKFDGYEIRDGDFGYFKSILKVYK